MSAHLCWSILCPPYTILIMDSSIQLKVQGLKNPNKRIHVFKILKKNYNIYFIQDTHYIQEEENLIQTQ